MIELVVVLAVIALVAAGFTGWMIAVRGATRSRRAAASSLADADHRATAAETRASDLARGAQQREIELGGLRDQNASARQEIGELRSLLAVAKQSVARHDELARAAQSAVIDANAAQAALRAELGVVQERLAQRESGQAREGRAVAEVQRVLAPLIERERLANKLAHLDIGRGTRGELPRLIDSIAHLGGFSTVVLSDEAGLPLAVNQDSPEGEQLAGLWSLLLTVADRIATAGAPIPVAILVHDAANQTILHRLFSSAGTRFLLTAVCRGRSLEPEALDPALSKLDRLLAGSALAS